MLTLATPLTIVCVISFLFLIFAEELTLEDQRKTLTTQVVKTTL